MEDILLNNLERRIWRVLHVEDDEEDYLITRELLSQSQGSKIVLDWVSTYEEGLALLKTNHYDAVLVDYDLGPRTGIELIQEITGQGHEVPLILFTGRGNYEVDVEAMKAGATLYLTKSEANPLLLERSIRYAIERKRIERERTGILESIQDGFFALDRDWRISFINPRAAQAGGYKPEELTGRIIWEIFPELLGTSIESTYRHVMDKRQSARFEAQGIYHGIWYEISVYPFQEGISIYWQDISEKKKSAEAIKRSEAMHRAIARNLPEGAVVVVDREMRYLIVEGSLWSMLGIGGENLEGVTISKALDESIAQIEIERFHRAFQGQTSSYESEHFGRVVWSQYLPLLDEQGEVIAAMALALDISERKRVEDELRFSEERFSKAFNATPNAMVLSRLLDGKIEMVNDSFERLFGFTRAEVISKTSLELNMFADPDVREKIVKKMAGKYSLRDCEVDIRIRSGEIRRANLSIEALMIGSEARILTGIEDITERKQAVDDLRESEEMLRLALSAGQAGAFHWDLENMSMQWSEEYFRIFGFEPGSIEPTAEAGLSRIHPDDRQHVEAALQKAIEEGTHIDMIYRLLLPDGSTRWVRGIARTFNSEQGNPFRMAGLAIDISEHKQAELELIAANRRRTEILESINDAFYSLDQDRHFTYVNQKAASLWGMNPSDLLGKNIWEVFPSGKETEAYTKIELALLKKQPIQFESYSAFLNEWVDIHIYPTERGISVYFQDISRRKRSEEALAAYAAELERSNRDLQEFAFVASHDMQEPLRKIEILGEILLSADNQLNEEQKEQLGLIRKSVGRMRAMVDGMLQLSRISTQARPLEVVNLSEIMQDVVSDLEMQIRQSRGVVEIGPLPKIKGDPVQLRQLFQNLIGNALKFQVQGGQALVQIYAKHTSSERVEIEVIDNGIGFDDEQAERIFQPFQRLVGRSQYEGSGIGLAVCRKIAERHGGEIEVHSKPGSGTKFTVCLPVK
jgi:PAS domain S-box-containing protein